jgi:hypothetical protein
MEAAAIGANSASGEGASMQHVLDGQAETLHAPKPQHVGCIAVADGNPNLPMSTIVAIQGDHPLADAPLPAKSIPKNREHIKTGVQANDTHLSPKLVPPLS